MGGKKETLVSLNQRQSTSLEASGWKGTSSERWCFFFLFQRARRGTSAHGHGTPVGTQRSTGFARLCAFSRPLCRAAQGQLRPRQLSRQRLLQHLRRARNTRRRLHAEEVTCHITTVDQHSVVVALATRKSACPTSGRARLAS